MVGTWESEDATTSLEMQCRWMGNAQFLSRTFSLANEDRIVLQGTQIIGWDPAAGKIRSGDSIRRVVSAKVSGTGRTIDGL